MDVRIHTRTHLSMHVCMCWCICGPAYMKGCLEWTEMIGNVLSSGKATPGVCACVIPITHMCMMYRLVHWYTACPMWSVPLHLSMHFSVAVRFFNSGTAIYTCFGFLGVISMHHEQAFPNLNNRDRLTMQPHLTRGPPAPVSFPLGIGLILQLGRV